MSLDDQMLRIYEVAFVFLALVFFAMGQGSPKRSR